MIGRTRGHLAASRYYVSIARQAREAGRPDIAALANLRSLIRHSPPGSDRDREIQKIANAADPAIRAAALEANLALARIAFEQKNLSEGQALLHKLDRFAIKRPILVYQPRYEFIQQDRGNGEGGIHFDLPATDGSSPRAAQRPGLESLSTTKRMAGNFDDLWIDVAFQIMPDGTVSNLKIADKRGDTFWMEPVLASIKQRRYTPGRPGDPNSTRLERYTYTSGWQVATGTHMLERSPEARVEYFDLSPEGGIAAN
jgi:hypothetical protein